MNKKVKFIPGKTRIIYGGVLFGAREKKAILGVLNRNWWGIAEEAKLFEQELAKTLGVKRSVFVNSGTSALDIGIRALKLPKGSEVIVPACTFPTPVASLIKEGLKPVVVDIELGNYFISPEALEKSISRKTKAILIVYPAGLVGRLDKVLAIAKKHKLVVMEDNCDGLGGKWNGKLLGTFGIFSAISTHAAHIIATGEGGALFTNDEKIADTALSLRDWGRIIDFEVSNKNYGVFPPEYRRYIYGEIGSNLKPLELQAAMGRVQLRRLAEFKKARTRNAQILGKILKPLENDLILPKPNPKADICWYTYPVVLNKISRTKVIEALDKANIEWRPILAGNIARQPAYRKFVIKRLPTPNADKLITSGFWVSVHPRNSVKMMKYVGTTIFEAISSLR